MAFRITSRDHTAHLVRGIPIASGSATTPNVQTLLDTDAANWANTATHSVVVLWYCEEPGDDTHEGVICELAAATGTGIELRYVSSGGVQHIELYVGGSLFLAGDDLPENPYGKWLAISVAYQKITDAATSRYSLTVWPFGGAAPVSDHGAAGVTMPTCTEVNLGKYRSGLSGSNRNARGVAMVYVLRGALVADGSTLLGAVVSDDIRSLINAADSRYDLAGPFTYDTTECIAGYNCFETGRSWFGSLDTRPPLTLAQSPQFDRNGASFGNYLAVTRSTVTVVGTVAHVDPYELSGLTPPRPELRTADAALGSTFDDSRWATRRAGPKVKDFVRRWKGARPATALVVAVCGNSRATISTSSPLRLPDNATFPGRTLCNNFIDMGLPAHFWASGLGGMANFPPPNASGIYAWGFDTGLAEPLTRTFAGVTSNLATATTYLNNSTYSRAWTNTRTSSTVAGSGDRYRGPGGPTLIKVGFGFRCMIRPENGIPNTDALRVRAYVANVPSLSDYEYRKEVAASAVNGADTLAASYTQSFGNRAFAQSLTISAQVATAFSGDLTISSNGTITVDNTGGYLTANHVGQWAEVLNGSGVPQDLVYIRAINNTTPAACVVTYEGSLQNTVTPGTSTLLVNPNIVARYQTVEVTFAAGEVAGSNWRGLDIRVDSAATGYGVVVLAYAWQNMTSGGVCPAHIGRNGCGTEYQFKRLFHVDGIASPVNGISAFDEMMQIINPDIYVQMTADQGNDYGQARTQFAYVGNLILGSLPDCEIVYAANGAEVKVEGSAQYTEAEAHPTYHQAMRLAATSDVPGALFVSWFNHATKGTGAVNRYIRGWVTEGPTHPSGVEDWQLWFEQLDDLAGGALSHGFGGRTRSALRYRTRG
jgi:hypothetical protein